MPLAKRTAPGILPAKSDTRAVEHERTKRNCLGESPIHRNLAVAHLRAACELANHFRMNIKTFRHDSDVMANLAHLVRTDAGIKKIRTVFLNYRSCKLFNRCLVSNNLLRALPCVLISLDAFVNQLLHVCFSHRAFTNKSFGIDRPHAWMSFDTRVHQRLCIAWLVSLVVSQPAETNYVEHDILV